jgi:enoyl-[acyl-carrier protein] reductase II
VIRPPPRRPPPPRHDRLDRLWARGRRFLGCELAVMGGAMTWVSERNLVSAISEAGGFGVLACGSMGPDALARRSRPPGGSPAARSAST